MTFALLATTLLLLAQPADAPAGPAGGAAPPAVRMIDVTGDGVLDKLYLGADGGLSLAVNVGAGIFEPVVQDLPRVRVADVHVSDLDGDGLIDLYLVSPQANVALRGDGQGYLQDVTAELGLADHGAGVSAERVDLDGTVPEELVLHNTSGDVVFWPTGGAFRRDGDTPDNAQPADDSDLAALQQLVAQAAELLALDPEEQILIGRDEIGQPFVKVGPRTPVGHGTPSSEEGVVNDTQRSPVTAGPLASLGVRAPVPTLTVEEKAILQHMSLVKLADDSGNLVYETVRMTGVNLQIVNGLEATNGYPTDPDSVDPGQTVVNGVGNLIVGYNELGNPNRDDRDGSHNIVVGHGNSYSSFGGIVGSIDNWIVGPFASVSGGSQNKASGSYSSVSGGVSNEAYGWHSSVSGGVENLAENLFTSVSGGWGNTASGRASSVSGGVSNEAGGSFSSVSGGRYHFASGDSSSVSGGWNNFASGYVSSVNGGQYNQAYGWGSSVSGGRNNEAAALVSSVSGGKYNQAYGWGSSVSGGRNNKAAALVSSVSGGGYNTASNTCSSISGGRHNTASSSSSSVSGGRYNTASNTYSSISGGRHNTASGSDSSVSAGYRNIADNTFSSVSGGRDNTASGPYSSVGGGTSSVAYGLNSTVSGGVSNMASGISSSVSGGRNNTASGNFSSVSGGTQSTAFGDDSSVSGGWGNSADGRYSSVSGGFNNTASGGFSSVSGGYARTASGNLDWVAGSLWENM